MTTLVTLPADPSRRSAQHAVYQRLRKAIVANALAPGTPLRAADLSAALGVSPTPIREALIRLTADGLAIGRPNRGVVVAPLSPVEVRHLYETRSVLDGLAAARAAERVDGPTLDRLRALLDDMERLLAARRLKALVARNREFHERIHQASGNLPLVETLRALLDRTQRFRNVCVDLEGRLERAHEEHVAILDALARRDARRAERLVRDNILGGGAAVASHIEALQAGAGDGAPGRRARRETP